LIMQHFLYRSLRNSLAIGLLCLGLSLSASIAARENNILVLGDSISAAYGMSLQQGWVALLAQQLQEQHPQYTVINASISGETTNGGLRRLPALLEQHSPSLVLIELGANDGLRGFPLATLRDNLASLVAMSQAAGARVILLPMEIPPNYGARYTSGFRQSYVTIARETNSAITPFVMDGVATDSKLVQADGIHPTVEAQPMLLDNVLPTVMEALAAL
jgi:acyl-CoA thioesterase-1